MKRLGFVALVLGTLLTLESAHTFLCRSPGS